MEYRERKKEDADGQMEGGHTCVTSSECKYI